MFNYDYLNDGLLNNGLIGNNNLNLVSPNIAYDRGNLFGNLYEPYKNYKINELVATNDRERLFFELSRMSFAAHEVNLYLDNHPDDNSMIALFNDYREMANKLIKEYETKYGALNISSDSLDQTPFMWEKNPWPWEGRSNV